MIPSREEVYSALEKRHGKTLAKQWKNASVAICGLGGLGSNVAISLARAGVGTLHLIDFDKVDLSNINRQQYAISQIGIHKTDALKNILLQIAPYCNVKTSCEKITAENISSLLAYEKIVCEAFDDEEQKAMLVNGVLETFPEKYIVASSGMAGLSSANNIKTRKIASRFFLCGDEKSDSNHGLGLISSRVMLCAAHQAHAILRIISGEYDT